LILEAAGEKLARIIDVGGGQSFLVDRLLDSGFKQVAVLDISNAAIEATKARLGERASLVEWMVAEHTTPTGKSQLFFFGVYQREN
jgi:2-polyprenyl-3-methyl-5-hydroxy-6-metoxy-1,4-benzoquinol methylase